MLEKDSNLEKDLNFSIADEALDKELDKLFLKKQGSIKLSDIDPYDRALIEKFPDQISEILD